MIGDLKEETNKSFKDCQESQEINEQVKEISQDLNIKREAIEKTQSEGILEMKSLGKQMQASPTKYKRWKRISGTEDMIKEIDLTSKKTLNLKYP